MGENFFIKILHCVRKQHEKISEVQGNRYEVDLDHIDQLFIGY